MTDKAPWITYRPELRVLDCTIRDGGLINNHQFSDELVRAVYDTCVAAGLDYIGVSPILADLRDRGRVRFEAATDAGFGAFDFSGGVIAGKRGEIGAGDRLEQPGGLPVLR